MIDMAEVTMRREINELKMERDALLKQIEGDPEYVLYFYQRKSLRQRAARDQLNRRNLSLRFALRVHEAIHGPLSREEYLKARDAVQDEQLRERIDDPDAK